MENLPLKAKRKTNNAPFHAANWYTTYCMVRTHTRIALGVVFLFAMLLFPSAPVLYAQDAADVAARRAELKRQLDALEKEIASQGVLLEDKRLERVSLERDIGILDAQIKKAELSIRARDIEINNLERDIGGKEDAIVELNRKLTREKQSLAQLLRKTNEIDDFSLVEIVLGNQNISEFFEDLDTFTTIKTQLRDSFVKIEATKVDTQAEKESLESKQIEEVELRRISEIQKAEIEAREAQKQEILDVTKGAEAVYQNIITSKKRTSAQIRAELFTLRDSAAIPFGDALDFANAASAVTGVRSALILGVIAQESRMGELIGTGNWRDDMHPTRDRPVFAKLMARLGLNPDLMPVSAKPSYGWGGAMGPAQFIPSTWILFEDRLGQLSGQVPPNPWDPRTAFIASGLLMADNGADRGTYAAERRAALRYFAGWVNAEKPAYAFYGDAVMNLATQYQRQIDILGS